MITVIVGVAMTMMAASPANGGSLDIKLFFREILDCTSAELPWPWLGSYRGGEGSSRCLLSV